MMFELLFATVVAALFAGVAVMIARASRRERRVRRDLLADCTALVENPAVEIDAAGYGVLRGRRNGREVALRPFADTLAFRRLPQLWLAATVRTETGAGATLEILRRPGGAEFYAAGDALPASFAVPGDWPQDTQIRGSRGAGGVLARLAPALSGALDDPRVKSVYVSQRGARAVRQIDQGTRGAFLLFRDSRFGIARVPPAEAEKALALAFVASRAAAVAAEKDADAQKFDEAAA